MYCLIKFIHMNFCPRLDRPMAAGVCVQLRWKVFFIATFLFS